MDAAYQDLVAKVDAALRAREAEFPERGEGFREMQAVVARFRAAVLDRAGDLSLFRPDPGRLSTIERFVDRPVFICGAMRSGSTLLGQLLDGHPALHVMPADSGYAVHRDRWNRASVEELGSEWIRRLVCPTGKSPFWFIGPEVEAFRRFLGYLYALRKGTNRDAFVCATVALWAANDRAPARPRYWVEKTPGNERHVPFLTARFPEARLIQIVRDPWINAASVTRLSRLRGFPRSLRATVIAMRNQYECALRNQREMGPGRTLLVRFEELIRSPEETLRKVCGFLDLPFEPALLTPTENRRQATSNTMFAGSRNRGRIERRALDGSRYLRDLSPADLALIGRHLWESAEAVGYRWDAGPMAPYCPSWVQRRLTAPLDRVAEKLDRLRRPAAR